jgi:type IV secretory pathway VirB10-like protein
MPIGRQAVMAAIIGSACGTIAALWSVGPRSGAAPAVQASPSPIVTTSPPALTRETPDRAWLNPAGAPAVASPAKPTPGAVTQGATALPKPASASVPTESDGQNVRLRARTLAARPDVKALVALRESVVRRAEERGETEAEASKQLLDDLDRYLKGARELRLKLDAEEFRRTRPLR